MKKSFVLVILLVAQASAQSQSIDSAQTDGLEYRANNASKRRSLGTVNRRVAAANGVEGTQPGNAFSRSDAS